MSWEVRQTRRFARTYKKLVNAALIADTDAAVDTVANNPDVGERKKGDLARLWVENFQNFVEQHGTMFAFGRGAILAMPRWSAFAIKLPCHMLCFVSPTRKRGCMSYVFRSTHLAPTTSDSSRASRGSSALR